MPLKIIGLIIIIILATYALCRAEDLKVYDAQGQYTGQVAWTGNTGIVLNAYGQSIGSIPKTGQAYKFYDKLGTLQVTAWGTNAPAYIINNYAKP